MIELTFLTQNDCTWCSSGKQVLAELAEEVPLRIDEIDLHSEPGRRLAAEHRLMFAPGLIANGRLLAHGRLSKRALRKQLLALSSNNPITN